MVALITPSYKNPSYAALWLEGARKGKRLRDSEIIMVVDGHRELYTDLIKEHGGRVKFVLNAEQRGMAYGQNIGVSVADSPSSSSRMMTTFLATAGMIWLSGPIHLGESDHNRSVRARSRLHLRISTQGLGTDSG